MFSKLMPFKDGDLKIGGRFVNWSPQKKAH
jgi:hypothetical protein